MLLTTTCVELRVVAGRNRKRAGRPHAVCGRPMIIHACHAMSMPRPCPLCRGLEKSLSERHGRGMVREHHGRCETTTAALCKSRGKDTISTPGGTAWQRNGMARHGNGMVSFTRFGFRPAGSWPDGREHNLELHDISDSNRPVERPRTLWPSSRACTVICSGR
jgi:hypothetical protein